MDTSELQKRIYLDGRQRYEEKTGIHPDAPVCAGMSFRVAKLQRVIDECKAKYPEADKATESTKPAKPAREVGPQMQQAIRLADAIKKLKAGQAGQASSEQVHKLPRHVVRG